RDRRRHRAPELHAAYGATPGRARAPRPLHRLPPAGHRRRGRLRRAPAAAGGAGSRPPDRVAAGGPVGERVTRRTATREQEVWREDLVGALASLTLVGGLFLDGWNHINLQ